MEKAKRIREDERSLMTANLKPMTAIQAGSIQAKSMPLVLKTPSVFTAYRDSELVCTMALVLEEISVSYLLARGQGNNRYRVPEEKFPGKELQPIRPGQQGFSP